jgi:hypothetical protein
MVITDYLIPMADLVAKSGESIGAVGILLFESETVKSERNFRQRA